MKLVLYVPDGPLAEIPLAALPGGTPGQYLIDEYRFVTLPNAAHLTSKRVAAATSRSANDSILLVGDVDFGSQSTQSSVVSRMASSQFAPLPGTGREIRSIAGLFAEKFPRGKLTLSQQRAASEATFRTAAPQHRVLHLATHGFCILEDPQLLGLVEATGSGELLQYLQTHVPEVLSGIALADANGVPSGAVNADNDDGILTALELSTLDLRQVNVAVLSACESGLGHQNIGEGLLGLQRTCRLRESARL